MTRVLYQIPRRVGNFPYITVIYSVCQERSLRRRFVLYRITSDVCMYLKKKGRPDLDVLTNQYGVVSFRQKRVCPQHYFVRH